MAGSCEFCNESRDSIKCGEIRDYLRNILTSQEGFCFVELVISLFDWLVSHHAIKYGDADY
jgi:hypothetical protein